jgi:excisionase family DNA binding protein
MTARKNKQSLARSNYWGGFTMQTQKALTVDEAAAFTGLKKSYLYKLISKRKIPFYKPLGGRVYFKQEELEGFIFRNR